VIALTYAEFNQNIFKNPKIKWFDKTGVMIIDPSLRAEITLSKGMYGYDSYHVRIVHKRNGNVTTKHFGFNDYLDITDRIDNRKDYNGNYHVWKDGGVYWFVAQPSQQNIKRLTNAIMEFIELYK
jgi:hypothetical protein